MNIYNNEFAACEKINRPGMGEFYQGSSIKLTGPTSKQKEARSYVPYKGVKYTTGVSKEKSKSMNDKETSKNCEDPYRIIHSKSEIYTFLADCGYTKDSIRDCLNCPEVVNCETAVEWLMDYGLDKVSDELIEVDNNHKEMSTDESEYDLYKSDNKKKFKVGDYVEIHYKSEIINNFGGLNLDKGYNKKSGFIKKIWNGKIEQKRKTFLPVSFKNCKFALVVLDDNKIISLPLMLLKHVKPNRKPMKHPTQHEYTSVKKSKDKLDNKSELVEITKDYNNEIKLLEKHIDSRLNHLSTMIMESEKYLEDEIARLDKRFDTLINMIQERDKYIIEIANHLHL